MKNTIKKIIIAAAVLFAAGFSQNAAAFGFYLNPDPDRVEVYIFVDYDTADAAEMAARQYCRDNFTGNDALCDTMDADRIESFGTHEVVTFNNVSFLKHAEGTRRLAYDNLLAICQAGNEGALCTTNLIPVTNMRFCGDGTAADDTTDTRFPQADECTMRMPADDEPTLNCGEGTTFTDGDNDGNCDCATDAQIPIDAESCRAAESLEECMDEGYMYFNPRTQICTNTAPNCTDNATLNDAGVCECLNSAFPILEERENTFSCRAPRNATDCPDEFFNDAVSPNRCEEIRTCGDGTTGTATQNQCECATEGDVFVSGSNMQMCETPPPPPTCGTATTGTANAQNECECATDELPILQDDGENAFSCRAATGQTDCNSLTELPFYDSAATETGFCSATNPNAATQNGSGRPKEFAYIGAGIFIIAAAATYVAGGDFSLFSFSPDFDYSITESGYSANAGGRMDLRKDKWHFYYSAKQANANGEFADFRYTSGGKYTADFWAAAFSESVAGETADYDFSLSANLTGGVWNISPVYRLHSEYADNEFDTQNSLNLQSEFRYNNWQIRPSAGFKWENANNFSETARFQINAIHRF